LGSLLLLPCFLFFFGLGGSLFEQAGGVFCEVCGVLFGLPFLLTPGFGTMAGFGAVSE
jgi:hypothetical protein